MMKLRSLWRGELPLAEAFWTWTIGVGLLVNLTSSVLFLTLIAAERPWLALFVGYGLSVPYNALAMVGVWRSSAHYEGDANHANLARLAAALVLVLLTVT